MDGWIICCRGKLRRLIAYVFVLLSFRGRNAFNLDYSAPKFHADLCFSLQSAFFLRRLFDTRVSTKRPSGSGGAATPHFQIDSTCPSRWPDGSSNRLLLGTAAFSRAWCIRKRGQENQASKVDYATLSCRSVVAACGHLFFTALPTCHAFTYIIPCHLYSPRCFLKLCSDANYNVESAWIKCTLPSQ